jgi:Alkylmercury lyase
VTSTCPVTGELIELTVTPDGVTGTSHPEAVVSFLVPSGPFDSGVIESFCHFVHFFASRQADEQWAASRPGTFLLTLGEPPSWRHAPTSGCSRTSRERAEARASPARARHQPRRAAVRRGLAVRSRHATTALLIVAVAAERVPCQRQHRN